MSGRTQKVGLALFAVAWGTLVFFCLGGLAIARDHPEMDVLVPAHVLKLCDEALGIVPEAGQEVGE